MSCPFESSGKAFKREEATKAKTLRIKGVACGRG